MMLPKFKVTYQGGWPWRVATLALFMVLITGAASQSIQHKEKQARSKNNDLDISSSNLLSFADLRQGQTVAPGEATADEELATSSRALLARVRRLRRKAKPPSPPPKPPKPPKPRSTGMAN